MQTFDVAIIGNGILAYSLAHTLTQKDQNLTIAIIGSQSQPFSATQAAGAMLGCFSEITQETFSSEHHQQKFNIAYQAKSMWPDWLNHIEEQLSESQQPFSGQGTFIIQNTCSGDLDDKNYDAILTALKRYNEPFESVAPTSIPGYDPIPTHRSVNALFLPKEGFISPNDLLASLHSILNQQPQVHYLDALTVQLSTDANNKLITLTTGETITANQVVIASGSASQTLIDQLPEIAARIPRLFSGAGYAISIEKNNVNMPHTIRTPNRSFACGLHMLPNGSNNLYAGATNWVTDTPAINPEIGNLQFLLNCTTTQINQAFNAATITQFHAGNRPVSLDTFPLIGETSIKGLWILSGTYRDGLFQSPLLARELANQIIDNKITLTAFTPERMPITTHTKTTVINQAVEHYLAGAYEHGMSLPKVGWDAMFVEMLTNKLTQVYNRLAMDDFVLPPDFLLLLDRDPSWFDKLNRHYQLLKESHMMSSENLTS